MVVGALTLVVVGGSVGILLTHQEKQRKLQTLQEQELQKITALQEKDLQKSKQSDKEQLVKAVNILSETFVGLDNFAQTNRNWVGGCNNSAWDNYFSGQKRRLNEVLVAIQPSSIFEEAVPKIRQLMDSVPKLACAGLDWGETNQKEPYNSESLRYARNLYDAYRKERNSLWYELASLLRSKGIENSMLASPFD